MGSNSLPSPPFIEIEGIANFRDIGGYPTTSSKKVRNGLVYRAADPSKVTLEGLKKMKEELGITTIFDFRSLPELQRTGPEWADVETDHPDPFAPYGITRHWTPVFAAQDYGPEQVALRYKHYTRSGTEGFVQAYRDILSSGTEAYEKVFRHLAQEAPGGCLVHCTAGKDRTGVLVALLFLLVGVEHEVIAEEYSFTDLGLQHLKPMFIERLLRNPALAGDEAGVANMVSSRTECMRDSIVMINEEFGGAETYIKDRCGLSQQEVDWLKRNLVA
ncbi:hypothetical protein B0A48_11931 [Cryoendolithus antarcticus]|uniref:Tyrosine specific protein phosphatases domain-containing protein n=1 Tax=Cryoendolithus antarcticus TaxID=1507870 RepID=A0A1V8ST55_9PEZI|nr:hypothetical protein B0A48_11931 [Cryoendolithus antarcticus]